MNSGIPISHRFAYEFSRRGYRGSSFVWKFARMFFLEKNSEIVTLPNGFTLIVDRRDWISKTIYEGTYERPLLALLNRIKVSGCFVDVGANIGVTLWNGMKNSSEHSTYCAIEPSDQCQRGLGLSTKNLSNSGCVFQIALGSQSEFRMMHGLNNPEQSGGGSLIQHDGLNGQDILVQVRTLDEVISENAFLGSVYMLKIDTEGYEAEVLAGAKHLVSKQQVSIFILEVSPSFSSTDWVKNLHEEISAKYAFFTLLEEGFLRKKEKLRKLSIEDALSIKDQWNLVIISEEVLLSNPQLIRIIK